MPTLDFSRNPDFGDSFTTDYKLLTRRNLSNQLITFKSYFWQVLDTFQFTVSAISESEVEDIVTFLLAHAGEEVTLIDYDGVTWVGIIVNDPKITQPGPNSYTLDENGHFNGVFDPSCNWQITLALEGVFTTPPTE